MPTSTYTPLANINPTGGTSSITFSSIPATYRDLIIVISSLADYEGYNYSFRFNGDTASNYFVVYATGSGSSTTSYTTAAGQLYLDGAVTTNTNQGVIVSNIMDYSATDKFKTVLSRSNQATGTGSNLGVEMLAGRWANTAAITSVQVLCNGNWATGSSVALYGIAA